MPGTETLRTCSQGKGGLQQDIQVMRLGQAQCSLLLLHWGIYARTCMQAPDRPSIPILHMQQ